MSDFVVVARFDRVTDADAHRLLLEHAGIASYLEGANLVAAHFLLANAIGGIKLLVAAADRAAAEEVLQNLPTTTTPDSVAQHLAGELAFSCSECGAMIRFPATSAGKCETCPECHEYVDVPEADNAS